MRVPLNIITRLVALFPILYVKNFVNVFKSKNI